jgi:hypothetical protein
LLLLRQGQQGQWPEIVARVIEQLESRIEKLEGLGTSPGSKGTFADWATILETMCEGKMSDARTLRIGPIEQVSRMVDDSTIVLRLAFTMNGITLTRDEAKRLAEVILELQADHA